jgi:hypothetical protein
MESPYIVVDKNDYLLINLFIHIKIDKFKIP